MCGRLTVCRSAERCRNGLCVVLAFVHYSLPLWSRKACQSTVNKASQELKTTRGWGDCSSPKMGGGGKRGSNEVNSSLCVPHKGSKGHSDM